MLTNSSRDSLCLCEISNWRIGELSIRALPSTSHRLGKRDQINYLWSSMPAQLNGVKRSFQRIHLTICSDTWARFMANSVAHRQVARRTRGYGEPYDIAYCSKLSAQPIREKKKMRKHNKLCLRDGANKTSKLQCRQRQFHNKMILTPDSADTCCPSSSAHSNRSSKPICIGS